MRPSRFLKHTFMPGWMAHRAFPAESLRKIEAAIRASEKRHAGELRFVVEGPLHPAHLSRPKPARARAEELFAQLRVWDTEHNSGVLIYVQLVDRRIEIVADRGIAARVPQADWDAVCRAMETAFRAGRFLPGALEAIERATALLERHYPASGARANELPDKPLIL
jgi:uncharacterized membrane protein